MIYHANRNIGIGRGYQHGMIGVCSQEALNPLFDSFIKRNTAAVNKLFRDQAKAMPSLQNLSATPEISKAETPKKKGLAALAEAESIIKSSDIAYNSGIVYQVPLTTPVGM
jgi:hypothetical protein